MAEHDHRPRTRKERVRSVIAMAAGVFVVLFAVLNTQEVTIHWVFTTTRTPLIWAIVVSAVLGVIAGLAITRLRRGRHH
jgi:uncharacterized integral membrane protein